MNNRKSLQARDIGQLDNNQEATDKKIISGYFIVFDTETELYPGVREEVSPDALVGVDLSDVKALIDHDTAKVLGRTKANTLSLSVDSKGLYGEIIVNGTPEEVMRRMYTEHIYEEAIPDMYKAQLELEQVGMTFEKPFLNLADAETSVIHSFAKGGEKDA